MHHYLLGIAREGWIFCFKAFNPIDSFNIEMDLAICTLFSALNASTVGCAAEVLENIYPKKTRTGNIANRRSLILFLGNRNMK